MNERLGYAELQRMGTLVDEQARSRQVWQDEYLRMLRFSANSTNRAAHAVETLEKVFQLLDMQPIQNPQIGQALEEVDSALSLCKRMALDEVEPVPLFNAAGSLAAFQWYLDMDLGLSLLPGSNGRFADDKVQAMYDCYRLGAKFGHSEQSRVKG